MMHFLPAVAVPARQVLAGATRVTVVDEEGKLVAIVQDRLRGTVRITLGRVQPPARQACCD